MVAIRMTLNSVWQRGVLFPPGIGPALEPLEHLEYSNGIEYSEHFQYLQYSSRIDYSDNPATRDVSVTRNQ